MAQENENVVKKQTIENMRIFTNVALNGPVEILSEFGTPHEVSEKFSSYKKGHAREYLLNQILLEVQQCTFVFFRWYEYLNKINGKEKNPAFAMELSSLIVEQSVWQRKLVEMLSTLILFSTCNEQNYFLHYLTICELEEVSRQQREQKEFFGSESILRAAEIDDLLASVRSGEAAEGFDLSKCWYLHPDTLKNIRGTKKPDHRRLLSQTDTVKAAIQSAKPLERLALGFYLKHAYSLTSQNIHFSPLRSEEKNDLPQLITGISRVGLLIVSIVKHSEHLLGLNIDKTACKTARFFVENPDPSGSSSANTGEVGDYVIVKLKGRDYVASVLEVFRSKYGYEAYRVRYVRNQPEMPSVNEDIVAGNQCGRVFPRSFVQQVGEATISSIKSELSVSHPHLIEKLTSPEVTQQALDQTMRELWEVLLKK